MFCQILKSRNQRKKKYEHAAAIFLAFLSVLGVAEGFLGRGTLQETEGDIFNIYCQDFDRRTTVWHHREITREAVRRVIVRYFKETPPAEGIYNHRDDMTLEETYMEYYGPRASPKPFLHTLENLVDAIASADSGVLGADPRYHFGSERFSESQAILAERWKRIVQAGMAGDYNAAIYMLGLSLASIQDFYSHTNWVELGHENFNPHVGLPENDFNNVASSSEETCKNCPQGNDELSSCEDNLLQEIIDMVKLTSGYSESAFINGSKVEIPDGVAKCSHGGSRDQHSRGVDSRSGINKELPTSCFSPHHHLHQTAAEQAIQATEYYLNLLQDVIGNAKFSRLLSLYPTPAIVFVLDTTDSMDIELKALTHVVSNLLEKHSKASYPPAEYILVPFGGPSFAGEVIRSQSPDEIYQALTQLRAEGGGNNGENSMSELRRALHYSPAYAHVFLITDNSIRDLEVFDSVVAVALVKHIQVAPVLTVPVTNEGIIDWNSLSVLHTENNSYNAEEHYKNRKVSRSKRQSSSFEKYLELAQRSGGQVIGTTSGLAEETYKIFESDQYPKAVLWREDGVSQFRTIKFPVDSMVEEFEISISEMVSSVELVSPSGEKYDLASNTTNAGSPDYSVVVKTPYLIQVRLNMNDRQEEIGEWTLSVNPSVVASVVIYVRTTVDIIPTFYMADSSSTHPSLQRMEQPVRGLGTYMDLVITGLDTAQLSRIESVHLREVDSQKLLRLNFPVDSPTRDTYLNLTAQELPMGRFSVVVTGKDNSGHLFRRESRTVLETTESLLQFPLGREVWGYPGDILNIPVTITNTNGDSSSTYFLAVNEARGAKVNLSKQRVTLGRNETVQFYMEIKLPIDMLPSTTNTIVVNATSTKGDSSHALAYLSVMPRDDQRRTRREAPYNARYIDRVPPVITEIRRTSCLGHLLPENCNFQWSATVHIHDSFPGLLRVTSTPSLRLNPPVFYTGIKDQQITFTMMCCNPTVTIRAMDLALNVESRIIDSRNVAISIPPRHSFRRVSRTILETNESLLQFPLGREVWGYPGDILNIPVTITNTNGDSSSTYFLAVNDARGTEVNLSQQRVTLGRNETVQFYMEIRLPIDMLPSTTNTIVVNATSTKGDSSHALAYLSVMPRDDQRRTKRQATYNAQYNDRVPPVITEIRRTSCLGRLPPANCDFQWSATVHIHDSDPGLLEIQSIPSLWQKPPTFYAGVKDQQITFTTTCCKPTVTIRAKDLALNTETRIIDSRNEAIPAATPLNAGAISGIVIGCIIGLILLIVIIVFVIRRQNNSSKDEIAFRRTPRRISTD